MYSGNGKMDLPLYKYGLYPPDNTPEGCSHAACRLTKVEVCSIFFDETNKNFIQTNK